MVDNIDIAVILLDTLKFDLKAEKYILPIPDLICTKVSTILLFVWYTTLV